MRLLSLKVQHFGPIRSAELVFGPGLNVLYGPNDLGKSHLVAAIRAALLYPHDRKEALSFVPWDSDRTPEVELEFELSPELRYRVSKTLAKGTRGSSELYCSRAGGDWKLEEKARNVDGKLCELLRWGLEPPGGGSGRKPAPDTYLTRVLLGRQAEVMEVFEHSLADDPQESGKDRLTAALQALGQDPLFRQVLVETTAEFEKAFTAGGDQRRGKDAVWAKLADQINRAREALQGLQAQVNESEDERRKLQLLLERQLACQPSLDQARERVQQLEARLAAQARLDLARSARQRVQSELEALAVAKRQLADQREESARLEARRNQAQEQLRLAEEEQAARASELQRKEAEREQGQGRRRDELQRLRLQDQHAIEQAEAMHKAAAEVGRLEADLARGEADLARKQAEVERHRAAAQGAALVQTLGEALTRMRDARGHHERLQDALENRRQLTIGLEQAALRLEQARQARDQGEEALRLANEALSRVQSQEGGQARLLREQELGRLRAEAEGALKEAGVGVTRARQALEAAAQVQQREKALAERRLSVEAALRGVQELEGKLAAAEAAVEQTKGVEALLSWRAAAESERQATQRLAQARERRATAQSLRGQAAAIDATLGATRLPDRAGLAALRQLDGDLRVAEARVGVGLTLALEALQALTPQAVIDGTPAPERGLVAGERVSWEARSRIEVALGDVARLRVEGGRPSDRQEATQLRARWEQEGASALRSAGVSTLDELATACDTAEQRQREAAELRRQAEGLERQASDEAELEAQLAAAQAQAVDRQRRLAGLDRGALEAAAQGLTLAALEASSLSAQRARDALGKDLAARRPELAAAQARLEGQEHELAEARQQARTLAEGLGAAPQTALARAEAAERAARDDLVSIDSEREALHEEASLELTQARNMVETAERERDGVAKTLDEVQEEHDQARLALAGLEGALAGLEAAAAEVDPAVPTAEVAQLRAQLAALSAAHPGLRVGSPDRPAAQLETEREGADSALRAVELEASGQQGDLSRTRQTCAEKRGALGGEWKTVADEAQATAHERRAALARTDAELAALEQSFTAALTTARDNLAVASAKRDRAQEASAAASLAYQEADKKLSALQGALTLREAQVAALDQAGALAAERSAEEAVRSLASPGTVTPVTAADLEAARRALEQADLQLRSLAKEIDQAQGALAKVGGGVVGEKAKDAEEALARAEDRQRQVALDYEAWKLLKETLEEAERSQTTNLGMTLAKPVAERFRELAGPAYGPLSLGPNLEADGVQVQGQRQELEVLSVGTREQLATLLRVTVASQIGSAVVLDDQLTQSDPARLQWFKNALRQAAATSQIVVVTCRPFDYLGAEELPGPASTFWDGPGVRAMDLKQVVKRCK